MGPTKMDQFLDPRPFLAFLEDNPPSLKPLVVAIRNADRFISASPTLVSALIRWGEAHLQVRSSVWHIATN